MKTKAHPILLGLAIAAAAAAHGQESAVLSANYASLQVMADQRWTELPVLWTDGSRVLNIGFDELSHVQRRLTYRLEHCEADWTPSEEVLPSEVMEGFAEGNVIEDSEESLNTTVDYTHYSLQIPNEKCRPKLSGNYRLTIADDSDGQDVVVVCFLMAERAANVQLDVTANTDTETYGSQQQVRMQVDYGNLTVTNPERQISTVVMQNRQWHGARWNVRPQSVTARGLVWDHSHDLIFKAGNEYHKYEILDVSHPTMGIDYIAWDGQNYQVFPYAQEPRRHYVYDEDANGAFLIRNSDNEGNDWLSEYVYVNFCLLCDKRVEGEVYVAGDWTHGSLSPTYRMDYDEENRCYRARVLQKQGYYNFEYLQLKPDGTIALMPTEGNFYQTENEYQALVYYRGPGERTDRLIGYQTVRFK